MLPRTRLAGALAIACWGCDAPRPVPSPAPSPPPSPPGAPPDRAFAPPALAGLEAHPAATPDAGAAPTSHGVVVQDVALSDPRAVAGVRTAVRARGPALRRCAAGAEVRLELRVAIAPEGRATDVRTVLRTGATEEAARCVEQALREGAWPARPGEPAVTGLVALVLPPAAPGTRP